MQGIYAITHVASGKHYVGSAKDMRRRLNGHLRSLRAGTHHCERLQRAWKKHGESAFDIEMFETTSGSEKELRAREQAYLDAFYGQRIYNTSREARGGCDAPESRKKLSESQKKWVRLPELGAKISATKRSYTAEQRAEVGAAISLAKKGNSPCWAKGKTLGPRTKEQRQRISDGHIGLRQSEESKAKKRASYNRDPEVVAQRTANSVAAKKNYYAAVREGRDAKRFKSAAEAAAFAAAVWAEYPV